MTDPCDLPWRELRAELRRFVAARVPAVDVDDVVQDALARIHRSVARVREPDRVGAWVFQVTRSAIADHGRRQPRARPVDEPIHSGATPVDDAAYASVLACIRPFVALLPEPYREAVTLVELDGASQVAAAQRLGIPISTMKARVQRGRARLRELVEQCCAIELDARNHVVGAVPRRKCSA